MPHRTDTHAKTRAAAHATTGAAGRTRRSTQRQRQQQCLVRFTEDEYARVQEKADRAGLAVAALLRAAALGDAGPRAQRRPPVDHQALRRLLGEVARVGNNINQIARALNQGLVLAIPELRPALAAYLIIRDAIYLALGMTVESSGEIRPALRKQRGSNDHQGRKSRRG